MREIKFRAINKDGEFIYGLPYTDSVNETAYYKEYSNRLCWRNEVGASCNQPYKNGTLEQYTGLKDKSGKEIYENTILDNRYLCIFNLFCFCLYDILDGDIKTLSVGGYCEITGNFNEIPENEKRDIDKYLQQAKREI